MKTFWDRIAALMIALVISFNSIIVPVYAAVSDVEPSSSLSQGLPDGVEQDASSDSSQDSSSDSMPSSSDATSSDTSSDNMLDILPDSAESTQEPSVQESAFTMQDYLKGYVQDLTGEGWHSKYELSGAKSRASEPTNIENLAVYVNFAQGTPYADDAGRALANESYNGIGLNSLSGFLKAMSYGKININTTFYPATAEITLPNAKKYYMPKSTENTEGYDGETERVRRESAMITYIIKAIDEAFVASNKVFDGESISFIFPTLTTELGFGELLWPHKTEYNTVGGSMPPPTLNGVAINAYNVLSKGSKNFGLMGAYEGGRTASVVVHEFMHILKFPDLYRTEQRDTSPVGLWDIMHGNDITPSPLNAYYQREVAKYGQALEKISATGTTTVTLDFPQYLSESEKHAVMVSTFGSATESFVIEARRQDVGSRGTPDLREGLLVYRINSAYEAFSGNASGKDFMYIFRPGETAFNAADGDITNALVKHNASFGAPLSTISAVQNTAYYEDGRNSGIEIKNVVVSETQISFDLIVPEKSIAGAGTSASPYVLTKPEHLAYLGTYPSAYFELGSDIDMKDFSHITIDKTFEGTLDGKKYTIKNLTGDSGIFSGIGKGRPTSTSYSAVVKDLTLSGFNITSSAAGALAESIVGADIQNVKIINSTITEKSGKTGRAGAIAASANASRFERITVLDTTISAGEAGGIIGIVSKDVSIANNTQDLYNTFIDCFISATITGASAGAIYGKVFKQSGTDTGLHPVNTSFYNKTLAPELAAQNASAFTMPSPNKQYNKGEQADLAVVADNDMLNIGYVSSNELAGTITPQGSFTALEKGDTVITISVSTANANYSQGYDVEVTDVENEVEWSKNGNSCKIGGKLLKGGIFNIKWTDGNEYSYMFNTDGLRLTGLFSANGLHYNAPNPENNYAIVNDAFVQIGDNVTYYDENGVRESKWFTLEKDNAEYKEGTYYQNVYIYTGKQIIDDKTYYFNDKGLLIENSGWAGTNNEYYIERGAPVANNVFSLSWGDEKHIYAFNKNGIRATAAITLGGIQYIPSGDNNYALVQNDFVTVSKKLRYYNNYSLMPKGWITLSEPVGDYAAGRYYQSGNILTGKQTINGTVCYFSDKGLLVSQGGWAGAKNEFYIQNGELLKNGVYELEFGGEIHNYAFSASGTRLSGTFTLLSNGYCTQGADKNYALATNSFVKSGTRVKYYDENGALAKGWFTLKQDNEDYKKGEYYQSTYLLTGKQIIGGKTYYFDAQGLLVDNGWAGAKNEYYIKDGELLTNGIFELDFAGNRAQYLFSTSGVRQTGSPKFLGETYYAPDVDNNYAIVTDTFVPSGTRSKYYSPEGTLAVGWFTLASDNGEYKQGQYYQTTYVLTGKQTVSGSVCYFDYSGRLITTEGWAGAKNEYYLKDGDPFKNGIFEIEYKGATKKYAFNTSGVRYSKEFSFGGNSYCAPNAEDNFALAQNEFVNSGTVIKFYSPDGSLPKNTWIKADKTLTTNAAEGLYYQTTAVLTGKRTVSGTEYYFNSVGQKTTNGWAGASDEYYLDETGKPLKNVVASLKFGDDTIRKYAFSSSGVRQKGSFAISGKSYYAPDKANNYALTINAFVKTGTSVKYYDELGKLEKNTWISYTGSQDGYPAGRYYQSTYLVSGKQTISGNTYFFKDNGEMLKDTWAGAKNEYYLASDGAAIKDQIVVLNFGISRGTYVFNASSVRLSNDFTFRGRSYCAPYSANNYALVKNEFIVRDNKLKYFGNDASLASGEFEYNGSQAGFERGRYYQSGYITGGKKTFKREGATVTAYLNTNGKIVDNGWAGAKNEFHLIGAQLLKNNIFELKFNGETKKYAFNTSGTRYTGEFTYEGNSYCAPLADNNYAIVTDEFVLSGAKLKYFNTSGIMPKNTWLTAEGDETSSADDAKYYQAGYIVTGKRTIDGKIYFFAQDGEKITNGWAGDKNEYYLVNGEPIMDSIKEIQLNGETKSYSFDKNGVRRTGEFTIAGNSYCAPEVSNNYALAVNEIVLRGKNYKYYGDNGILAKNSWLKSDGTIAQSPAQAQYYQTTYLATGKRTIEGKIYFFEANGEKVLNGWQGSTDEYYVLNGEAVANAKIEATWEDGEEYSYIFNKSGVRLKSDFAFNGSTYCAPTVLNNYAIAENVFLLRSGKVKYYAADGAMPKGEFVYNGGQNGYLAGTYYQDGSVFIGKKTISGEVNYFDYMGRRVDNGWAGANNEYYIKNGTALTGAQDLQWNNIEQKYIFSTGGVRLRGDFTFEKNNYCALSESNNYALVTDEFVTRSGKLKYYSESGAMPNGVFIYSGTQDGFVAGDYYQKGSLSGGKKTYKNDSNKTITIYTNINGMIVVEGWAGAKNEYYIKNNVPLNGKHGNISFGGKTGTYIFSASGTRLSGEFSFESNSYCAPNEEDNYAIATNKFVLRSGRIKYYDASGALPKNTWLKDIDGTQAGYPAGNYYQTSYLLTGKQTVAKKTYFFGYNGLRVESGWQGSQSEYYVKNGEVVAGAIDKLTWQDGNAYFYAFNTSGVRLKGDFKLNSHSYCAPDSYNNFALIHDQFYMRNGKISYFGEDGAKPEGWFEIKEDKGAYKTGKYYQTTYVFTGKQTISGKVYLFDKMGRLNDKAGWVEATDGFYYVLASGAQDEPPSLAVGIVTIQGKKHGFSTSGLLYQKRFALNGYYYIPDQSSEHFALYESTVFEYYGAGKYTAIDSDARQVKDSWATINGKKYYQKSDTYIAFRGRKAISGKYYIFDESCALADKEGFVDTPEGRYYMKSNDGIAVATGIADITQSGLNASFTPSSAPKGKLYGFDSKGLQYTKRFAQTVTEGSKKVIYYYVPSPDDELNQLYTNIVVHYCTTSTSCKDGLHDGSLSAFLVTGRQASSGFVAVGGKVYYQTSKTYKVALGYQKALEDNNYYFDPESGFLRTGWIIAGDDIRYFTQTYISGTARMGVEAMAPSFKLDNVYNTSTKMRKVTVNATFGALGGEELAYSFDDGKTWRAINTYEVKAEAGSFLEKGHIKVRGKIPTTTVPDELSEQWGKRALERYTVSNTERISLEPRVSGNKGIDVSSHQGVITAADWQKVADSGIGFAVIRAVTWSNAINNYMIDTQFESNVRNAKAAGLSVGAYIYSYAFNAQQGVQEADVFGNSEELKRLRADNIVFDLPIFIDYEDKLNVGVGITNQDRTAAVRAAMLRLEQKHKLFPGFYTYYGYMPNFDSIGLANENYPFWYAYFTANIAEPPQGYFLYPKDFPAVSSMPNARGAPVSIWQFTSQAKINGINGRVDVNYMMDSTLIDRTHAFYGTSGNTPKPVEPKITVKDSLNDNKTVTDTIRNLLPKMVQAEVGGFAGTNPNLYKAQAVAAHSYLEYQIRSANVPTVALRTPSASVKAAVADVADIILLYGSEVANTAYASANNGVTASSEQIWGKELAYLKAGIQSPYDKKAVDTSASPNIPWYGRVNTISNARMVTNLEKLFGAGCTRGIDPSKYISSIKKDSNGYVTSVSCLNGTKVVGGGKFYDNMYGLYSPAFDYPEYTGSGWKFKTYGNGHGVGMSQWGAFGMALEGRLWSDILKHYYPSTQVSAG